MHSLASSTASPLGQPKLSTCLVASKLSQWSHYSFGWKKQNIWLIKKRKIYINLTKRWSQMIQIRNQMTKIITRWWSKNKNTIKLPTEDLSKLLQIELHIPLKNRKWMANLKNRMKKTFENRMIINKLMSCLILKLF